MPDTTFLLELIKLFKPAVVFLKAVASVIIFLIDFLDTPNLSKDCLNVFKDLLEKPGKIILFFLTISSVLLNKNSDITLEKASGSLTAKAAPLVSLDISLNLSSKFLDASFANAFIADYLPSNLCMPSNNSCDLLLLDLKGLPTNRSTHLSNRLSL